MSVLIVLDDPKDWALDVPEVQVVPARQYLIDPRFSELKKAKVFNMCGSYKYQSVGYYVSLVAAARGHRPLPDIATIQDLKMSPIVRIAAQDLEELITAGMAPIRSGEFVLSIYFGRNIAKRYDKLSRALFNQFPAPFLRATFKHQPSTGTWALEGLRLIGASEIPDEHWPFVLEQATKYFDRPARRSAPRGARYDLAILYEGESETSPSDDAAIQRFIKAAESMDFDAEIITKEDYGRLPEFDALFIRETTGVNHYTFRFARRAAAEGLVVIDDPDSILRCTNKVYLAELLARHDVATPKTEIISRETMDVAATSIGFPCVLKQPDSSSGQGVVKCENALVFERECERLFKISELLIVQEFCPTRFDWRIGVIDKEPLYACKYHMADEYWQVFDRTKPGQVNVGRVEAVPLDKVPPGVLRLGVRAARLVGDGLYGVDVKELGDKPVVIEINDNPSIDHGHEDQVLKDEIYKRIIRTFVRRLEANGR